MRVLVTETYAGDSDRLIRRLRELGVHVTACHDGTASCRALRPGGCCPLDDIHHPVDLVVDVRRGDEDLVVREYGVICGERANRPVWIVSSDPDEVVTVPAAVRDLAVAATEEELLVRCQRRHPDDGRLPPI